MFILVLKIMNIRILKTEFLLRLWKQAIYKKAQYKRGQIKKLLIPFLVIMTELDVYPPIFYPKHGEFKELEYLHDIGGRKEKRNFQTLTKTRKIYIAKHSMLIAPGEERPSILWPDARRSNQII